MKRHTRRKRSTREKQAQSQKRRRNILIAFMCVVLVCVGYIGTDVFIIRHAEPVSHMEEATQKNGNGNSKTGNAKYASLGIPSIALDDSVMLSSVIGEARKTKLSSVAFELKRSDGTIGYTSNLTTVETFGAVSMPAKKLHESVKTLNEKNITPIAVICCYKDNTAAGKAAEMTLMNGDKPYKDSKGNTYLNPDSDSAVKYLKEIVTESYNLGVRVFVLTSVNLPDGIREGHSDGFNKLVNRLNTEIGGDAVFLEGVSTELNGWNVEDGEYNDEGLRIEIKKLRKLKSNQIYVIKTEKELSDIKKALKSKKVSRYIIFEEE